MTVRTTRFILILITFLICLSIFFAVKIKQESRKNNTKANYQINEAEPIIKLPPPKYESKTSLEQALLKRRSVREYKDEPLTIEEISQILWSAQGITDAKTGFRTTPSAGALNPLEVYLVSSEINDLAPGVYHYLPQNHELEKVMEGNKRLELGNAALGQSAVSNAPGIIILTAVYERTTQKYGERGIRYVHMEAGHAAQNIYLQATVLNLGTVTIGAFNDKEVKTILNLPEQQEPLYLMPFGKKE